jgi:AraC-like DNA-binding protein
VSNAATITKEEEATQVEQAVMPTARYYKYLPVSLVDQNWGLYVLNIGFNKIGSHQAYPAKAHPAHHYFSWERGRVLNEFQFLYITKGEGIFESGNCKKQTVKEGTVILLFPGEWHRYKPKRETGWEEYWVGFRGTTAENFVKNNFISPKNPVLHIGMQERVFSVLSEIIEETSGEKSGYQPYVSGAVMYLLGFIHSLEKKKNHADAAEAIVDKGRLILRRDIDQNFPIDQVADELQVSYSWFRKAFKTYTGMSPGQYLLQLKMERAKIFLTDPSKSIKGISYELNFKSRFYFSKLFKRKTGLSPENYRIHTHGNNP